VGPVVTVDLSPSERDIAAQRKQVKISRIPGMPLVLRVRFDNDQFPLFDSVQLLNGRFVMKDNLVPADKMYDYFRIGRQPEEIKIVEKNDVQLIIMPYFLVNCGIKIKDKGGHQD
jgi:hypothetical protein